MSGIESIAFLLLLFLVELQAMDHQCNKIALSNCTNNPRLTVMKSRRRYTVTLQVNARECYNDFCIVNKQKNSTNLKCKDICEACETLQPKSGVDHDEYRQSYGKDPMQCELQVDAYLNNFCAQFTSVSERATTPAMMAEPYPTSTIIACSTITAHSIQLMNMTVSVCPTSSPTVPYHCNCDSAKPTTCTTPQISLPNLPMASQIPAKSVENSTPVTALGALLAFSVVLVAVVTIGWVCTCVTMKKREARKSPIDTRTDVIDLDDDDNKTNEERFFQNPTDENTHTSMTQPCEAEPTLGPIGSPVDQNVPETTYDSVQLPSQPAAENGPMYDVLNRGKANGSNPATEAREPYNDENYSQLHI